MKNNFLTLCHKIISDFVLIALFMGTVPTVGYSHQIKRPLIIASDRVMKDIQSTHPWYINAIQVKWVLEALNLKYVLEKIVPKRAHLLMMEGGIDGFFGGPKTAKSLEFAYFPTISLSEVKYGLFAHVNHPTIWDITSIHSLKNYDGIWHQVENVDDIEILQKNNKIIFLFEHKRKFLMLKAARTDFILDIYKSGLNTIKAMGLGHVLKPLTRIPLKGEQLYFYISKNTFDISIAAQIDEELKKIKKSKKYQLLIQGRIDISPLP